MQSAFVPYRLGLERFALDLLIRVKQSQYWRRIASESPAVPSRQALSSFAFKTKRKPSTPRAMGHLCDLNFGQHEDVIKSKLSKLT